MSPFPHVDPEALNDLLSMPYDEPDMADVERVCDEVRHEPEPGTGLPSEDDLDFADTPIRRTLCMSTEPGLFGRQCRDASGHEGLCDWERPRESILTEQRREQLREGDTPSGVLPVIGRWVC